MTKLTAHQQQYKREQAERKAFLNKKAVRRGNIYCAPWCGGGCTVEMHNEAQRAGAALAKALGPRWKAEIWENLGWHYRAKSPCGRIGVHAYLRPKWSEDSYSALFGEDGISGRWVADGPTPHAAVSAVLSMARAERNEIDSWLADADGVLVDAGPRALKAVPK